MDIHCEFKDYESLSGNFYCCFVTAENILENQELKFIGQHVSDKSNDSVTYIRFNYCTITKVPQGLTKIFPNLKGFDIDSSGLKKIVKNDLIEYKNFNQLWFECNEIEVLPGNLFEDFKNLHYISFYNNKLKVIGPKVLDGLEKLKFVDFKGNENYTKCFSIKNILNAEYLEFNRNAALQEVKEELLVKFIENSELYADYMQQKKLYKPEKVILDDLKALIQDESTKDIKIVIDGRKFPGHKFLLAARSPTLSEIIENIPEIENLNLVDISVEIFEKILKFLYTDELPGDDGTNFLHLFAAAGKLKIMELKDHAAKKIIENIEEENVAEILKLSNRYNHDEMRHKAFEIFKKKYQNFHFKHEFAFNMNAIERFCEHVH